MSTATLGHTAPTLRLVSDDKQIDSGHYQGVHIYRANCDAWLGPWEI